MGGYAAGGAAGLYGAEAGAGTAGAGDAALFGEAGTGGLGVDAALASEAGAGLTGTGLSLPVAGEAGEELLAGGIPAQSTGPGVTQAGYDWLNTPSAAGGFTGTNLAGYPGAVAGSTAAGRLLGLGQTGQDLLSVGGAVAPGILGYLGAGEQSDAYRDVANQYLGIGAPYRSTLEASYRPDFDLGAQPGYGDAFNRMADISARSYSSKFGNPAGSPSAQAGILGDVWQQGYLPALASYRGQLGQFGGLGLNTAGAGSLGGAGVAGGKYDAIGYGLGSLMNPQPKWQDIFKQMGTGQYKSTIG